jgi:hypothetical protein
VLGDGERTVGVAGQEHALGEVGGRLEMDGAGLVLERHSAANPSETRIGACPRVSECRVEDSAWDGEAPLDTR